MDGARLPSALWIEAHLKHLDQRGIPYYIINKGAYAAGTILLKLNGRENGCAALIQQRDAEGELGWTSALSGEHPEESMVDDYIRRAVSRDPDLWAIEIEDRGMKNPFEGKIF